MSVHVLFANSLGVIKVSEKAKVISKISTATTLVLIGEKDLKLYSKSENIQNIMKLAINDNKIGFINQYKYIKAYEKIEDGDKLLLKCLKTPNCNLDNVVDIAAKSSLHTKIIYKDPLLGLTKVNHLVGALNENLMVKYFQSTGWKQINGEVGRNGIDGLFIKRNKNGQIIDVLITESKYNKSGLQYTKSGQQMTNEWVIRKIDNLKKAYPNNNDYVIIEEFVKKESYRSMLWNLKVESGNLLVALKKVHDKEGKSKTVHLKGREKMKINYKGNQEINLDNPANEFHKKFVTWYKKELEIL